LPYIAFYQAKGEAMKRKFLLSLLPSVRSHSSTKGSVLKQMSFPMNVGIGLGICLVASAVLLLSGCGGKGSTPQTQLQSQNITFSSAPTLYSYQTATAKATASSGLAVTYSSSTTSVCTVDSSSGLVTDLTPGLCTIAANQAGNSTYAAAAQATQNIVASDNVKTYSVVTTITEPMTAPNNSIFTGAFTYDLTTNTPYDLFGVLTESMTQQSTVTTPEMTAVALGYQLSTLSDNMGGDLLSTFAMDSTNVFDLGGFASGGKKFYGFTAGAMNPYMGGVGNAYVTIDFNLAAPTSALSASQINLLAYGDCTGLGMMMSSCMTGVVGGGTMMGAPSAQTITATGSTAQTITFGAAPALTSAGDGAKAIGQGTPTATVKATASSGLTVTYSSVTPAVCFVYQDTGGVGTFKFTTPGQICTIAADQYGNTTYAPAGRATQSITLQ